MTKEQAIMKAFKTGTACYNDIYGWVTTMCGAYAHEAVEQSIKTLEQSGKIRRLNLSNPNAREWVAVQK